MNRTLGILTVLLIAAVFASSGVPASPQHNAAKTPFSPAAGLAVPHDEAAAVALADMRAYVGRHYTVIKERPESFRTIEAWNSEYDLRWVTFEVAGGAVRVYHATSRADSTVRYTFVHDGHATHGHSWEPVH